MKIKICTFVERLTDERMSQILWERICMGRGGDLFDEIKNQRVNLIH